MIYKYILHPNRVCLIPCIPWRSKLKLLVPIVLCPLMSLISSVRLTGILISPRYSRTVLLSIHSHPDHLNWMISTPADYHHHLTGVQLTLHLFRFPHSKEPTRHSPTKQHEPKLWNSNPHNKTKVDGPVSEIVSCQGPSTRPRSRIGAW